MLKLLLIAISLSPLCATLAYDIMQHQQSGQEDIEFSALGFLWTKFSPDTYRQLSSALPPEIWEQITQILTQPAIYIFGALATILIIIIQSFAAILNPKR